MITSPHPFLIRYNHLASISASQQGNGTVQATRYLPFGGYRAGNGRNPITSHALRWHGRRPATAIQEDLARAGVTN
ncbi:MAG: hypothetical protein D6816_18140 [Bacteroidetes bacterium]|nr:MAG: hypothetical protein D6816_18140 [Bacteroidota bacterium]